MKTSLLAFVSALSIAAAGSAVAQDCQDGEIVIRFSHVVAASGHPKGDAAAMLAKRVNEEMNGKACMQVFADSQLYDDDQVMEAMLLGDVHLAAPSLAKFESYTLKYRIFDLPFLFSDLDAVDRFAASDQGKGLLNAMTDVGFAGLGYWSSGLKQFSADKPLVNPADAAGLKFRIQSSDVADAMIQAMGGSAQKLAFKDVYGALKAGVVDGQENTWSNIYTQKFHEVQDGITETNHQLLAYLLVTSQEWLNGLEPDVREQFLTITAEVTAASNSLVAGEEAKNRQRILDSGAVIRELTPEQRQAWVEAMKPVWGQFEADIGLDLISAALAANATN
ncbi:C4-dicarboxylate-binding periplasmic protein precursor [Pannonibacter phragmitetus]|uniref:C4-dicarboxylate-binding periplasmic protein n=1 Tax=Pannonibacter phragmitetus TaxID=121719 RepID=A0A379A0Q8_9HYPH|nr:DctP family TRAP transporter solute-binding subunit [Pannonibacter phragmitetus]SUB02670.1 C4-dicarboxylate-binding periplasmic protein precursor [Pannonibacter phragmitetus]